MPLAHRTSTVPLVALLALAGTALAIPPATYSTVAVSGQSAPGLPGLTLARVNGLTVNDVGTWVFHGVLAGAGVTIENDGSVWSNRDGSLVLEYREGAAAPLAEYSFSSMPYPALNNENALSLTGSIVLTPPGTTPTKLGVFVETKGVLQYVAADTFPAPGTDGSFSAILPAPLSAAGKSSINANSGAGLWSDRTDALELTALAGTPAPDIDGATFAHIDPASQNHEGGQVFRARVTGEGIDSANNTGIWVAGAITRLLARTGDQAPGFDKGVVLSELSSKPSTQATLAATFWARVAGPDIGPGADQAIYTTRLEEPLTALVRSGDPAHAIPEDVTYHSFGATIAVNDPGDTAYIARLAGPDVTSANNHALYVYEASAGEPRLVAREGAEVFPSSGVVYASFVGPAINAYGRVAFLAFVSGAGITSANNLWLMAEGPDQRTIRVAMLGEAFEVAPGDVRTVRDIAFEAGNPMEGHGQFNVESTLAFRLNFTDFTDALVTATLTCGSDWNDDGIINSTDVGEFINNWFEDQAFGTLVTDFDFNGIANSTDVGEFINAWFRGCDGF